METYKVLGASDTNLKALRLALTVKGSTRSDGKAIADLKYKEEEQEYGSERFFHPFQMSLALPPPSGEQNPELVYTHDAPVSGVTAINISAGRIQICSDTNQRTNVAFYGNNAVPVSGLESDNGYYAILALRFNPSGQVDSMENVNFPCNVYYVNADVTSKDTPSVPGFITIPIGKIVRETISGSVFYSLGPQRLVSDLFYDFKASIRPFSITADSTAFENGKYKNSYTLNDFHFYVKEGNAVLQDQKIDVQKFDFTCAENTYVYCSINEDPISGFINIQQQQQQFHDIQNKKWNYLIGYIENNAQKGLIINQYISQPIVLGSDTYKVKCISGDAQPDYLSAKFKWDTPVSAHPFKDYSKTFIGGLPVSSSVTQPGLSGTQWQISPVWLYMNIDNFDESKNQFITNDKGNLKWDSMKLELSGSLANWQEVKEISGQNVLVWKPEFSSSGLSLNDNFYFMSNVNVGNNSVLSGTSFGQDNSAIDSVMIWKLDSGTPNIMIPPSRSDKVSAWILGGDKANGLRWLEYKDKDPDENTSGNLRLSGSMTNIYDIVSGASGQVLRVKSEFDPNYSPQPQHMLLIDTDGKLKKEEFNASYLLPIGGSYLHSIMYYSDEDPVGYFRTKYLPQNIDINQPMILANSFNRGINWIAASSLINIDLSGSINDVFDIGNTTSGQVLRVKSEFDPNYPSQPQRMLLLDTDGNLIKEELNASYLLPTGGSYLHGVMYYSDEDPVGYFETKYLPQNTDVNQLMILTNTFKTGINWKTVEQCLSGQIYKVKVSDNDLSAGFLVDKFGSQLSSVLLTIQDENNDEYVSIDINPDYFYSQDESIAIEPDQNGEGINFYLSSYLVQTVEDDIPGYLSQKIDSASGSLYLTYPEDSGDTIVNIEINPEYFFSSDGSISIEQDNNGLDFIISSYLTQINANDQPGYLADKLDSTSGSLIITPVTNDGDGYMNLEIDPTYFYSSNGTVMIEYEDGLDFTIDEEGLSSTIERIISSQVSEMISSYVTEHFTELISSYFPSGAGLLTINNGQLGVISIGTGVAVGNGSTLTFEQPEPCDGSAAGTSGGNFSGTGYSGSFGDNQSGENNGDYEGGGGHFSGGGYSGNF